MKMGKYNKFQDKEREKPGPNPIWRGIGCILMVLLPLVTFALAAIFTPIIAATGLVPYQLLGHLNFPDWMYRFRISSGIANFIWGINNLGLSLVLFFIFLLLLIGVASLVYVTVLQAIGPPRYSDKDAPPSKYKPKVYKR